MSNHINANAYFGKMVGTNMKQEVYHSSTLGPIPLSFTGRRLMQNLREAFQELLQKRVEQAARGQLPTQVDWTPVSEARGKLAQYMSQLEKRPTWRDDPREVLMAMDFGAAEPTPMFFGRAHRPTKHEYFVRVLEGNFKANKRQQRLPGSIITTEMHIGGSMQVTALTADEALNMAVEQAHKHGFTELTKKDFEVRYLGPVE